VPGLKVIGATSSFAFRGRDKPRAAKALNATHVLDGSVRRMDDRVRVAAQLSEAESGVVIWSERYDRDLAEAFALQEEIAGEVAKALTMALGEARRVRAPKLTAALSDTYFEARELMRTGALACIQAAAAALERVVREAPDVARAWAGLAAAKLEVLRLARADRARLVEDAREAAERALGADPSMGEAYAVLSALESEFFGRWREREALIEKALAAEPNNPHLLFRHGQFLVSVGRVEDGYAQQARAFELDPLDPMLAAFHGYNVWSKRSKSDGRAILEDAAKRYADNVFVWFMRLNTAALDGDFATAAALRADGARLLSPKHAAADDGALARGVHEAGRRFRRHGRGRTGGRARPRDGALGAGFHRPRARHLPGGARQRGRLARRRARNHAPAHRLRDRALVHRPDRAAAHEPRLRQTLRAPGACALLARDRRLAGLRLADAVRLQGRVCGVKGTTENGDKPRGGVVVSAVNPLCRCG
jgi:Tfp pilus assembly protein PilF